MGEAKKRTRPLLGLAVATLAFVVGCNFGNAPPPLPPRPQPPAGPISPEAVSDEAFARSVHAVLRDGQPSVQRQGLLAGVVRRQMTHAAERLRSKQRERGFATALGGLYLIRAGEYRPEMLEGPGDEALALAASVVAPLGDEGRSLALYRLRKGLLPAEHPAQRDIDDHISAIERWAAEQEGKGDIGPTEAAGMVQRRAVARALLEPSDEAMQEALRATQRWIDAGLVFQAQYKLTPKMRVRREEMVEGVRAFSSGATTLAALFLRHGDPGGATEALRSSPVRQVASTSLIERLELAAREGDPGAWREILEFLSKSQQRDEETAPDRALLQAAVFGAATEIYRRDPTGVDVSLHLASSLIAYGMAEAAPAVLVDAARKHPDPRVLSLMLDMVLTTMAREEDSDDPASARRTFAASAPLLELADQPGARGRVRPSASKFRYVAAAIEARAGELSAARDLLTTSVRDESSADAWRLLAEIERQLGAPQAALERIQTLMNSPEALRDPLVRADGHLMASDLQRDLGARDRARDEAIKAYQLTLMARQSNTGGPVGLARAERLLARVLDRLGDDPGAARASERAIQLTKGEPRILAVTVLEAVARAYVMRDVQAARKAAQETFGSQLRDDELIYIALWLRLLEKEMNARPDGTAAKLLASVEVGPRWSGRLAAWANGKLSDADLAAAARTPGQRTEALFYKSIAQRAAGKASDGDEGLRQVTRSATLDLIESQIARDLLAGNDRRLPGPLPSAAP